jgi:hypothetical protein
VASGCPRIPGVNSGVYYPVQGIGCIPCCRSRQDGQQQRAQWRPPIGLKQDGQQGKRQGEQGVPEDDGLAYEAEAAWGQGRQ